MDDLRVAALAVTVTHFLHAPTLRPSLVELGESLPLHRWLIRSLIVEMVPYGWFDVQEAEDDDRMGRPQDDLRYALTPRGEADGRALIARLVGTNQAFQRYLDQSGLSIFAEFVARGQQGVEMEMEPTAVPTLYWEVDGQDTKRLLIATVDMLGDSTVQRWRRTLPTWLGDHCMIADTDEGVKLCPVNMVEEAK
ncbi:hypothetical protein JNUCC0626_20180 [Lentzea sp. JNUCC 0626]|uniref:hypothetical protein n=1 Tax=Lentzea sp. JNUCC 0626 TaxID=3367513 RepID=UPI003747A191